jgi:hypothetical protein
MDDDKDIVKYLAAAAVIELNSAPVGKTTK